MNYFELYPGDYLRDTSRLTMLEHGAYLRLLMAYYGEEEPLPAAHGELFVIVSAVSAADKAAVVKVADRYFPIDDEDGLRHNSRADTEIAKAQKRIQTARVNGAKNKPKKNPAGDPTGTPSGSTRRHTHSGEALHTPHATRKAPTPDTSPASAKNSELASALALALQAMGYSECSSGSPDVRLAAEQGVTVAELQGAAAGKIGKPISYLVTRALGKRTDAAEIIRGQPSTVVPIKPVDPAEAERAKQIAKLEDQVYDVRHLCDKLGHIDADERDRRIAALRDQQRELRQGASAEAVS
ncbi:YdaU family protein [Luteimonas terrae]|uniref:Uncharacterized protein YdaU (DUF1376 family) n=1 Tax=Luteimonas terrae TaxID=1530191 RepID=A0ABU1XZ79_9GAMM|nr:DUF1376 domain-containing protein [Luteimonas terrae]MDR7193331.1 uncharacterized protein YdaU (DUF1376 family) [Luteimonas terrae]